ncbi:endonuclease/exonuclease/phosphatase family protein [Vibrio metschnikovii]|uniref:endonuclease/exonuclease/phosphatase family protein n=1 Tax=Vibrio metschnikovii TaxID=28172 RepID=UPI0012AD9158|nr:endonuclease/exonuclease/phosphatase family protein [Vibrio metschnikovii]
MKKMRLTPTALLLSSALLLGCNQDIDTMATPEKTLKIATYNLSFDRNTFAELVTEMQVEPAQQQALVEAYLAGKIDQKDKKLAQNIIQIRNVAAVIQHNRPDVLMMAEFNNDGTGEDTSALIGFQNNYLSVAQSRQGAGGEPDLEPIDYPFAKAYATNTGLLSEFDLDNNGQKGQLPGDAWGFGFYHGQYAFALLSKYPIDASQTRTFQHFKWKDMPNADIPTITICDGSQKIPQGMVCGDPWYSDAEWQQVRLSSKNHVDAPIIIPTADGEQVIHLLMSHPTPPVFDPGKNQQQNAAEVQFWHHYIQNQPYFYDDAGNTGGLANNEKFVIMGDLNLDPVAGDGLSEIMQALHADPLLNQKVTQGTLYPSSLGAAEFAAQRSLTHPHPQRITSTFGLGVDYALPSANLTVIDSGVYWPASDQVGYRLMNDSRLGRYGDGKDVSSDHRLIWVEVKL